MTTVGKTTPFKGNTPSARRLGDRQRDGASVRCGLCGKEVVKVPDHFCPDCEHGLHRSDPPLFTSMILVVLVSSIIAAQYLILRSMAGEGGALDQERMFLTVLTMLAFTMVLTVLLVVKKLKNLLRPAILKGWAAAMAPIVVPWCLAEIMSLDPSLIVILAASGILVLLLTIFIFSVRVFGRTSRSWLIITSVGALLYYLGLVLSFSSDGPSGLWVLNGPYLMVIGLFICSFSSYKTIRAMDLPSSEDVPLVGLTLSFLLIHITLFFGLLSGSDSRSFIGLLALCFLMLSVSTVSMAARSMTDHIMSSSKRTVLDHIRRAETLRVEKNTFYALQQIDMAIKKNPIDGFGRSQEIDNPLYRLEGTDHTKVFEYQTNPTVLALNEKGMTLSSQGLFAESTRQFIEATRRDPKYSNSYWNLATMLLTTPGKNLEAYTYLDMMLTIKHSYLRRWADRGVQTDHASWMVSMFEDYSRAMDLRSEVLIDLTKKGDIWAYYRLVGYY